MKDNRIIVESLHVGKHLINVFHHRSHVMMKIYMPLKKSKIGFLGLVIEVKLFARIILSGLL